MIVDVVLGSGFDPRDLVAYAVGVRAPPSSIMFSTAPGARYETSP
jgi:hypothetical protein